MITSEKKHDFFSERYLDEVISKCLLSMSSTDVCSRKLHLKFTVIKLNRVVLNITKYVSQKK